MNASTQMWSSVIRCEGVVMMVMALWNLGVLPGAQAVHHVSPFGIPEACTSAPMMRLSRPGGHPRLVEKLGFGHVW